MKTLRLVVTGTALLIVSGCEDGRGTTGPTAPAVPIQDESTAPVAAHRVSTSGRFDALVDFATLTLTPKGDKCLLQVSGQFVFSGTIQGTASGQTTALVFASCTDVATNPPGTFADVFTSKGEFEGTVDGKPAKADLLYIGRVQPGGEIAARLVFSRGVWGVLETVNARVAVGGEYRGSVFVK